MTPVGGLTDSVDNLRGEAAWRQIGPDDYVAVGRRLSGVGLCVAALALTVVGWS